MLQNAYFLAKIGADTAENEQHVAEILPTDSMWSWETVLSVFPQNAAPVKGTHALLFSEEFEFGAGVLARRRRQRASVGKISAECCSFSAVSAPIFARKYAFCNIFQNLPDYLAEIFEIWQILQILQMLQNLQTFAKL